MKFGVVYIVKNTINGKVYIGQTVKTPEKRWEGHVKSAIRGDGFYLHRAISQHGPENFTLSVICEAESQEDLNRKEVAAIERFGANDPLRGYNVTRGGEFGRLTGEMEARRLAGLRSQEFRERRRRQYTGSGNPFFGKKHTAAVMEIMRLNGKMTGPLARGRKLSDYTKRLISASWEAKFPMDSVAAMRREAMSVGEISKKTGVSRSAIYRRLHRAGLMEPARRSRASVGN